MNIDQLERLPALILLCLLEVFSILAAFGIPSSPVPPYSTEVLSAGVEYTKSPTPENHDRLLKAENSLRRDIAILEYGFIFFAAVNPFLIVYAYRRIWKPPLPTSRPSAS